MGVMTDLQETTFWYCPTNYVWVRGDEYRGWDHDFPGSTNAREVLFRSPAAALDALEAYVARVAAAGEGAVRELLLFTHNMSDSKIRRHVEAGDIEGVPSYAKVEMEWRALLGVTTERLEDKVKAHVQSECRHVATWEESLTTEVDGVTLRGEAPRTAVLTDWESKGDRGWTLEICEKVVAFGGWAA